MSEVKPGSSLRWRRLLLEVAAIFVGITMSFLVDDWREERQDTETFRRIPGEVYYDIIRPTLDVGPVLDAQVGELDVDTAE